MINRTLTACKLLRVAKLLLAEDVLDVDRLVRGVTDWFGWAPSYRSIEVLDDKGWTEWYGKESELLGETGGIMTPEGDIRVKQKSIGSALHELVHGAMKAQGGDPDTSERLNEGVTQAVTMAIAKSLGIKVPDTYKDERQYVMKVLLPAVGMKLGPFSVQYAKAGSAVKWLVDTIWKRGGRFMLADPDWGTPDVARHKKSLTDYFKRGMTFDVQPNAGDMVKYLVFEKGVR